MKMFALLLSPMLMMKSGTAFDPGQAVSTTLEPQFSQVAFQVQGRGDQIYLCARQKDGMGWILKGPAATLYDASNQPVGRHGEGPQWTWKDGSAVRGTLVGRQAAPDPANIPWLLLKTDPFTGPRNGEQGAAGKLDAITYVKRSETQGGLVPVGGCDAANIGASKAVPYSATYTFYVPRS